MTELRITKAWLEGEGYELSVAAEQFATGTTRVVREDQRYYLTDPDLDLCWGDVLMDAGATVVQRVNAVCRMADAGFKSLALSGVFNHSDGGVTIAVAAAEGRVRGMAADVVTIRDGTAQQPGPTLAERFPKAAARNPDVANILTVIGSGNDQLDWVGLWKVYELIRKYAEQSAASGSGKAVVRMGWAGQREIENFEASANHPHLSGQDARHAHRPRPPFGDKIELREGRELINRLVCSVIDDVL